MFPRFNLRMVLLLGAVTIGGLLTACGGSTTTDEPTTNAGGSNATSPIEVTVTLTEFAVDMSQTEFEAGVEYRFVVSNEGAVPHELMFLPPVEAGAMDMEEMDEMAVAVFSDEDLEAGATAEQTFSFPEPGEGSLEGACHLPGHYEAGMKTPITVTS